MFIIDVDTVFEILDNENIGRVFETCEILIESFPFLVHFIKLLSNIVFFRCTGGNLFNRFKLVNQF